MCPRVLWRVPPGRVEVSGPILQGRQPRPRQRCPLPRPFSAQRIGQSSTPSALQVVQLWRSVLEHWGALCLSAALVWRGGGSGKALSVGQAQGTSLSYRDLGLGALSTLSICLPVSWPCLCPSHRQWDPLSSVTLKQPFWELYKKALRPL